MIYTFSPNKASRKTPSMAIPVGVHDSVRPPLLTPDLHHQPDFEGVRLASALHRLVTCVEAHVVKLVLKANFEKRVSFFYPLSN